MTICNPMSCLALNSLVRGGDLVAQIAYLRGQLATPGAERDFGYLAVEALTQRLVGLAMFESAYSQAVRAVVETDFEQQNGIVGKLDALMLAILETEPESPELYEVEKRLHLGMWQWLAAVALATFPDPS